MANTLTKTVKGAGGESGLGVLLDRLVEEKRRIEGLLRHIDDVLAKATPRSKRRPETRRLLLLPARARWINSKRSGTDTWLIKR